MESLINYFKSAFAEVKHISWPTRKQTITFTGLVILISVLISLYLGFFDTIFTTILKDIL